MTENLGASSPNLPEVRSVDECEFCKKMLAAGVDADTVAKWHLNQSDESAPEG